MRRKMAVAALLALAVAASATAATGWRVVATSSADSELYAMAHFNKTVKSAGRARVTVSASGVARVDGTVGCVRKSDIAFETRTFAFRLKAGTRPIPVPLKNAECSYGISALLEDGGRVTLKLAVIR